MMNSKSAPIYQMLAAFRYAQTKLATIAPLEEKLNAYSTTSYEVLFRLHCDPCRPSAASHYQSMHGKKGEAHTAAAGYI